MDFRDQFSMYPNVKHDDHLDAAAMAVELLFDVDVWTMESNYVSADGEAVPALRRSVGAVP